MVSFIWEIIPAFLLIFVLIFAILQKSKILGSDKKQIDALIALAIALIFITVPVTRGIVVNLMPWLAVGVTVILVFLILYGFVAGDLTNAPNWMKVTFGILSGVFVLGLVLYFTGLGKILNDLSSGGLLANIVILVIIGAGIAIALSSGKK